MDGLAYLADFLVFGGIVVITLGVLGVFRMPDTYTQLHASSKAVVFGVIAVLAAITTGGEPTVVFRVVLVSVFLVLTTPVAAHVIARAAYRHREPMETPGAIDESGRLRTEPGASGTTPPDPELGL